jgi:hypothetical protein
MSTKFTRRKFLGITALAIGMPTIIPGAALGKNGAVAPSNRIVMGGIGPRGRQVLSCFLAQPDVQFVAIADVQESRRETVRRMANKQYGNEDCYKCRDMMEILGRDDIVAVQITTGDHRRPPATTGDHWRPLATTGDHWRPLACARHHSRLEGRQGHLRREAVQHDDS